MSTISSENLDSDEFIELYKERFNKNSIDNEHLATASLHVLLGTLLRHSTIWFGGEYIDLRMSTLAFQDSGSGKTPAYNFTLELATKIEISAVKSTTMTVPAAIGSFIHEDVVDPDTGAVLSTQKERAGEFSKHELIMYNEGTSVLENPEMIRLICEVLDPIKRNQLVKSLAQSDESICSYPETSFFIVTYVPKDKISDIILRSGIAPRCLLFTKEKTLKEKSVVNHIIIGRLGKRLEEEHDSYEDIVERLESVKLAFLEGVEFSLSDQSRKLLKSFEIQMMKEISALPSVLQENLSVFVTRYLLLCPRLAAHKAALDYRDEIKTQDIKYGIHILQETWEELIEFSELSLNLNVSIKNMMDRFMLEAIDSKKEKCIPLSELLLKCKAKFNKSNRTMTRRLKVLIKENYILEEMDGVHKNLRLTDEGIRLFKSG